MNIGFICLGYETNMAGINRYTKGVLEQLSNEKFNKYCFGPNYLNIGDMEEIHCLYNPYREQEGAGKEYYLLSKLTGIDIVHSFYRPILLKYPDIKTVLTIHDVSPLINLEWFGNDQKVFELFNVSVRKSAHLVDKIAADSKDTKESVVNIYDVPEEKIEVVTPAIASEMIYSEITNEYVEKTKQKFSITGDYILSICTFEPRKNLVSLIKAYDIYRENNKESDIQLVLTGRLGWNYDGILQKIKSSKFSDDIILTDYVTDYEMGALYTGAYIFAYISYYEGFGMPILEALHYGKAVLASDTTAMPEVGGDSVCYCNPYDLESICNSLEYLLENEEYRKDLQGKAVLQAKKFSYQKSAENLGKMYCQLAEMR